MIVLIKALIFIEVLLIGSILMYRWALRPAFRDVVDTRSIVLLLLMPAVGFFCGNVYIYHAFLAIAVFLAGTNRVNLCGAYLLMVGMTPDLAVEMRVAGMSFGFTSTTFALGVGAVLRLAITRGPAPPRRPALDLAVLTLIFLFTWIDGRGTVPLEYARSLLGNIMLLGAPYLVISRAAVTGDHVRTIMLRFGLAGFAGCVIAVHDAINHWPLYEAMLGTMDLSGQMWMGLNVRAGFMRAGGPMLNVTAFALFAAATVITFWASRASFRQSGYYLVTFIGIGGLLASQSRGAWLAVAAAYVVFCATRGLKGRATAVSTVALLGYALSQVMFPEDGRLAEALGRSGHAADTAEYRVMLLERGLGQVRAHPFLGQSGAQLNVALSDLVQGEGIIDYVNAHLYVAMRSGLLGLAVWIAIWGSAILASRKYARATPGDRAFGALPVALITAGMIGLVFTSTVNRSLLWPMIGLALASAGGSLARRPIRDRSSMPGRGATGPGLAISGAAS